MIVVEGTGSVKIPTPRKLSAEQVRKDLKGMGFTGTVEKLIKFRMLGAKITEIPFILRYDQKKSPSKMVTSITTFGYLTLIIKYVYPWGDISKGWRKKISEYKKNRE